MKREDYRSVVCYLKKKIPIDYPVYVRRVKMPKNCMGDCWFDEENKFFLIRIEKKVPNVWACDILLHEISHCRSYFSKDKNDHGPAWGIAYAEAYRILMKHWGFDEDKKVAKRTKK